MNDELPSSNYVLNYSLGVRRKLALSLETLLIFYDMVQLLSNIRFYEIHPSIHGRRRVVRPAKSAN